MAKYLIKYALGGGFGGIEHCDGEIQEFDTESQANDYAYEMACDEYSNYDGMHGLRSIEDIMEEEDYDYEEAEMEYLEERESWLDYSAKLATEEEIKEIEGN